MPGDYLVDTNIVIALFNGDANVLQKLREAKATFISTIAIGELYFGAYKSLRVDENVRRIDEFAAANIILVCDKETARLYGATKNALKIKGKPIPENDIWIAATCLQYGLTLVSRDAHFKEIAGLTVESW